METNSGIYRKHDNRWNLGGVFPAQSNSDVCFSDISLAVCRIIGNWVAELKADETHNTTLRTACDSELRRF